MRIKLKIFGVFFLILGFFLFNTCTRNEVEEPSPVGPSTFSIILDLSLSPNVVTAGVSRDVCHITASLKKYDGIALSGKDIHFEIGDANGNKLNLGYFEGNKSVQTITTNGNGEAEVDYYGPTAEELTGDASIYIYARASWDGKEFISNAAQLDIIQDIEVATFTLLADPNVLFAGESREKSTLTATLKTTSNIALSGETVHFEITDETGTQVNMGHFEGNEPVISKITDDQGVAEVDYFGPLADEITENTVLTIKASVGWEGSEEEEIITATAVIQIIADPEDIFIDVSANPNVLFAGTSREKSTITATVTQAGNQPVADKTLHFEITDENGNKLDLGHFEGNEPVISKTTDSNGNVTVDYYGPLSGEISENTTVTIRASAALEGSASEDYTYGAAAIEIIKDMDDISIQVTANPNVLFAGTYREKSTVTATVTQSGNMPVANKTLYFEITDESGNKLDLGYFDGEISVKEKTTDSTGTAETVYYGPIAQEVTENTTIYIKVWLAGDGEECASEAASICIVRDAPDLTLDLIAEPYILLCGEQNPTSTIKAYFKKGSTLLSDRKIYFQITSGSGEFTNGKTTTVTTTDGEGIATVTYRGPTKNDLDADETVTIEAQPQTSSLYNISETVELTLIKEEEADYSLEMVADPSTVICGDSSSNSEIRVQLTQGTTPVSGKTVLFQVTSGEGDFGGSHSTTATTDSDGIARVTYTGPDNTEISADSTATIEAQVEISEFEILTAEVELTLVYKD